MKYDDILGTVGNTPVVRINRLAPAHVNLYVKVESFNPMGSVKDRLALGLIEDAERRGSLKPGQTVVEATSGNTGIGLAMVCAQRGYPLVIVMAENFSVERRKMMRFLGARVVLTPASERGIGMLAKAVELAEQHGWFLCRQFENEANAEIHAKTTAREIVRDFEGERLDYWVTGFGTGGTLKGVARVLKAERPDTRVVVCEPENSQVLASGVPQPRDAKGAPTGSHPAFRTHLMQGWSPDFVPKLAEDAATENLIDGMVTVSGADAIRLSRELAQQEGIFTGISGGATFGGALRLCKTAEAGTTLLCMLPDIGERYLSTPLFDGVPVEMSEEETTISESTPNFRFGMSSVPSEAPELLPEATPEAHDFVKRTIADPGRPVILFAYEYCEFCWSLRRMFAALEISHETVDLDSTGFRQNDWGGKIREALRERTEFGTLPQLFVGGEFVGGCVETLDAFRAGKLQASLERSRVGFKKDLAVDPYTFLPSWLHPR